MVTATIIADGVNTYDYDLINQYAASVPVIGVMMNDENSNNNY